MESNCDLERYNSYLKLFDNTFYTNIEKKLNIKFFPILHRIFVNIQECLHKQDKEYKENQEKTNKTYEKLNSNLNEKQKEVLKKYDELKNNQSLIIDEQLFMFGFLISKELEKEQELWKK